MVKKWLKMKYAKLVLLAILIGIASVGAVVAFTLSVKDQPAEAEAEVYTGPDSALSSLLSGAVTGSESPLPKRKSYPIGKWDMDIPYLNPFGSQDQYRSVEYTPNQYQELRYVDENNREVKRVTSGDVWQLQVAWEDETLNPFDDLILYMVELGGEFYRGPQEDKWVIHAMDEAGSDWWGVTAANGKGYKLTVYKERRLRSGETVAFRTADFPDGAIYFMTDNTAHKYQSLLVDLPDGEVQVHGKNSYMQGQYARDLSYVKSLAAYKSNRYALADIPQDTTTPILWTLKWSSRTAPKELSVTLDEGEDIVPISDGEQLGALKVQGDMLGKITIGMSSSVTMTHPELNLRGDVTPEGDTLFWLPSGYWNVVVKPANNNSDAALLNTRLIPVHSGQMTVVDVKPLVQHAYGSSEVGNASGKESELVVTGLTEDGGQATVSFMLLDSRNPKFTPTPGNTEIIEGGKPGKLIKLERVQTPPSIVLALDSSGSMSASMNKVLDSARAFISGLPDNAHIQVIDFDSEIRLLPGTSKQEVLAGLSQVKALGATTLYDSILRGLDLLKELERPTLLVFTDGVDSNTEQKGSGSKASKQTVEQAVRAAGIPLFTIGFGPDHDANTMRELAGMSEGTYYSAADAEVLGHVFTAINDRLGNHYVAVYERPEEVAPSDVPVISLTLDVSGSMDVAPSTGNGDYRLDKMKRLLHEFVQQTPENSLIQMMSFSSDIQIEQAFTSRKSEIVQAIGELKARGATDIHKSTQLTFKSLKKIPSDKRVIVYVTDAALDVDADKKDTFEKLLTGIKEEGIVVLWVGLATEDAEAAFQWAAEKSGGKYVISEDPEVLSQAFQEALDSVKQKPAEKVSVSLSIRGNAEGSGAVSYSASELADFPALKSSRDTVALNTIAYQSGIKLVQYEEATASLLTGRDIPGDTVQIYKRVPLNVQEKNKAMELTAHEIYYLKRLKGVDAPRGKSFMAVDVSLTNIYPEGVLYLIPDFASHFFVRTNNTGTYPASTATWLAESPLAPPGENSVSIKPDETMRGILVFLVPDEVTEQASVHFYDTSNGHITLALIGTPDTKDAEMAALPTRQTGKLSETFNLTVTASSDWDHIEEVELKNKISVFKVIEAELQSQVQALLKFNPQDRFYLKIGTGAGPFMIPVHTATALLPYGLLRPVTVGAGSSNLVRFAFQTPSALKDGSLELYADLHGGAMTLPFQSGTVEGSTAAGAAGAADAGSANSGAAHRGDGAKLAVNALAKISSIEGRSGNFVVADITLTDEPDGSGTSGFGHTLTLVSGDGQSEENQLTLAPDRLTDELLLGIHDQWAVFDGRSRRGLLVFAIPSEQKDAAWTLQSSVFPTLKQPIAQQPYAETGLLSKQVNPPLDLKFDAQLAVALSSEINKQRAKNAALAASKAVRDSEAGQEEGVSVPAPLPIVYGLTQLDAIRTFEDFRSLMTGLKWLPSSESQWYHYRYSPEAVLSQGWGTEVDLANVAGGLLAKLGYRPSLRQVTVTNKGREALRELGRLDKAEARALPAWTYSDADGKTRVFVVPFMKDLSELDGLVFLPGGQDVLKLTPAEAGITVYYKVEPRESKGLNSLAGQLSGALAGGGGDSGPVIQEVRMLQTQLALDQLSNEALDIRVGSENGLYTAVLENQTIQVIGDKRIDPSKSKVVGVRIEVQLRGGKHVHETTFQEDEEIFGVFHTIAVNLPDLTSEATNVLQKAADRAYQEAPAPNDQSALIWYTRHILYRFAANQTTYEQQLAQELDVTAGRTGQERVIVVTVRRKDDQAQLRTSINLLQSANQLHRASEEASRAFHVMSGLYASRLEGEVLPGNKADFMEVWSRSAEDTKLFLSLKANRKEDLKYMEELGVPETLLRRAQESDKALLLPTQSTRIYGENRWAWLEIDPVTFETIAVFDTGEHGGFAEYILNLAPVSPSSDDYQTFMAGSFLGVATSVWSVSSFSLILSDYDEIIAAAKAYTKALGEVLSGMMDAKDLPKLEYSMSPVKLKLEDADFDYLAKYFEEVQLGKEAKIGQDILGFTLGFKSGAAYYFKKAAQ